MKRYLATWLLPRFMAFAGFHEPRWEACLIEIRSRLNGFGCLSHVLKTVLMMTCSRK